MCVKRYSPPEMFPYVPHDLENALRLAAQERFEMMLEGRRKNNSQRRSLK